MQQHPPIAGLQSLKIYTCSTYEVLELTTPSVLNPDEECAGGLHTNKTHTATGPGACTHILYKCSDVNSIAITHGYYYQYINTVSMYLCVCTNC